MIASKSQIRIIAAMTISGQLAQVLYDHRKDEPRSKTIVSLCDRTWERIKTARSLWPKYDASEGELIARRVHNFFKAPATGWVQVAQLATLALGLITESVEEMERCKANPQRIEALVKLMSSVKAIARYYDRRMDRVDDYEAAGAVIDEWREVVDG